MSNQFKSSNAGAAGADLPPQILKGTSDVVSRAQLKKLKDADNAMRAGRDYISQNLTDDHARRHWQARFDRVRECIMKGESLPNLDAIDFCSLDDIKTNLMHFRSAIRQGCAARWAEVRPICLEVFAKVRLAINDAALEIEQRERGQAAAFGVEFTPSLSLVRLRSIAESFDPSRVTGPDNPSVNIAELLAGIVSLD